MDKRVDPLPFTKSRFHLYQLSRHPVNLPNALSRGSVIISAI